MTACPPDCVCGRHRVRTPEENAEHGARISAAAERRRHWATEQVWATVHRRCVMCGRLLAPTPDGMPPQHRQPARLGELTGAGQPWCTSRRFA